MKQPKDAAHSTISNPKLALASESARSAAMAIEFDPEPLFELEAILAIKHVGKDDIAGSPIFKRIGFFFRAPPTQPRRPRRELGLGDHRSSWWLEGSLGDRQPLREALQISRILIGGGEALWPQ